MALLMRRLLVDAQAKLRRMVEEHSANLTSRIDSDYPNSLPAPVPGPACLAQELKLSESASSSTTAGQADANFVKPLLGSEEADTNACDVDVKCVSDNKKDSYKSNRPNSIESRRSKSLCNTSSVDSNEDAKKEIKKTKSNPVKCEISNVDTEKTASDSKEISMTIEESASPLKDSRSSPENRSDSPKPGCSSQPDLDSSSPRSPRSSDGNRDDLSALIPSPSNYPKSATAIRRLRLENERLQAEVTRLRRLVVSGATSVLSEKKTPTENSDPSSKTHALEMELQLAKEALTTLKADKRRLKAEKFDLLNQMKQLYATLEDKEKELRDFIRSYGQVRDNETSLQQLSTEREERERERWSLLRHARDEAERSLSLAAQLNAKELQLQQAQEQLQEARRQLASSGCLSDQESLASLPRHSINGGALTPGSGGLLSGHHGLGLLPGDRGSCSADSGVRVSSDRESGATSVAGNLSDSTTDGTPTITVEGSNREVDAVSVVSSVPPPHMYQLSTKDCSPTLSPLNANNFSRSVDSATLSRSVEQLSSPLEPEPITIGRRVKQPTRPSSGRGGTWGSISRVFARSRHRNKASSLQETSEHSYEPYRSWSPLTEEGYAEKLRLLREASSIPMERWRAPTVLAWLEVALGMPQYGARCAENIKSGKIGPLHGQVLLELSDLELECGLGITHPMHRKKIRLAIEEHRHPALVRYPCIAQLGHTWVSSEWLPDLGLSQYSESFAANMVDARMLEHLSKKELEKYLGVTRKFHQASIVHGIHLLRIMKYDRQALAVRRHQCENMDADPLVWTNQRFIRWARSIDLGEYADNLKDSGVHGGLVVLEPSFNGDTMATALGIPASKNIIRRHLTAELEALILPARSTLEHYVRVRSKSRVPGGSLGRSFSRSCGGLSAPPPVNRDLLNADSRRTSIRGSLSRALGLNKTKIDREREKQSPTSSSENSSVISRISPPLQYFSTKSSRSGGESPIYAQPFAHIHPSSLYQRRSEDYDTYACRSIDEYDITKSVQSIRSESDQRDNISKKEKSKLFSGLAGGSLHRGKKQHRRVRSIGDIDVIHVEPV
ncbi:kazrin isoform X2 [Anoplophora glabripennis]|uniref:kazrin isoform X2 n=1 Tax=Anoplophora glabripennis TaxID=217634 RepID=UPI0008753F8C|nr:kazrin isoform X2 [Anoplophora glabripennis]